jgi:hypothetical protein
MTVAEYVAELLQMPQDMQLLIERGEWGPCEPKLPRVEPIHKWDKEDTDWKIDYMPEYASDYMDEEVKSQAVIL